MKVLGDTLVTWEELSLVLGWPYSRTHTWRLMKQGKFPQSIKLGEHPNSHPVWPASLLCEPLKMDLETILATLAVHRKPLI